MAKRAVFGVTSTRQEADIIVNELHDSGFALKDISVLYSGKHHGGETTDGTMRLETSSTVTNHAPEGAAIGATAGTALGGALGLLAGIGALAIPGIGPFIAAGPIIATLSGIGVGAAVGGVSGALVVLGLPERHARVYEVRLREGGILVAAHCDDAHDVARATAILTRHGAGDITTSFESGSTTTASGWATDTFSEFRR